MDFFFPNYPLVATGKAVWQRSSDCLLIFGFCQGTHFHHKWKSSGKISYQKGFSINVHKCLTLLRSTFMWVRPTSLFLLPQEDTWRLTVSFNTPHSLASSQIHVVRFGSTVSWRTSWISINGRPAPFSLSYVVSPGLNFSKPVLWTKVPPSYLIISWVTSGAVNFFFSSNALKLREFCRTLYNIIMSLL